MKIAFLGPAYPQRGGIAQFIAIYAQKLINAGHEVKIFSFKKQYPDFLFPGKTQNEESKKIIDLPIKQVVTPYNPLSFLGCAKKINQFNPDVLIFKYWIPFFAPLYGTLLRFLLKKSIKTVCVIDNISFHEKWLFADLLTKFALKKTNTCIAMSKNVYNDAISKINIKSKKLKLLHHPNYDFYKNDEVKTEADLKNRILFFGYIKPYKGLDVLLNAMPLILKQLPNLKLTIAGEIYGDDVYSPLIKKLKLEKNIDFYKKFIANEEVESFFTKSDVCVLPYKHATQSGITQLSFSFNIPVIATNCGGIGETVFNGKNGYLIEPNNPKKLAEAIIDFYKKNQKKQFVEFINLEKKKYSWQPFINIIEEL